MGQNITLVGDWTGVSGINLNRTGGGRVRFADPSPTTAVEADVAAGKIFLKADGSLGTGTGSGGGSPTLQVKNVTYTPTTTQQTDEVTADTGFDGLSKVNVQVAAVPTGSASTPATTITANPSISVDTSTGEITASVSASRSITPSVSPGYVSSGSAGTVNVSGIATHQLTVLDDSDIVATITDTPSQRRNTVSVPTGWSPGLSINPFAEMATGAMDGYSIDANGNLTINFSPQTAGMAYTSKSYELTGSMSVQGARTITPSRSRQTAIMADTYATGAVMVDPIPSQYIIPTGTKQITANGTGIDVTAFAAVDVAVPAPTPSLQTKSVSYTPSATAQSGAVTADAGYDGLSQVNVSVGPIPSEYIIPAGSKTITQNGTFDVTSFEDAIVNVAATGGLQYETGTWTPSESIARPTISFSKQHSEPPIAVLMADATGTAHSATQSNYLFAFFDAQRFTGVGYPYSSSGFRYAAAYYSYRANSTSSISSTATLMSQQTTSDSASGVNYPKYWATATEFYPYSGSTGRLWKSGRTYKWIAIWNPTT